MNIFGSQIEVLEFLNATPATRDKLKSDFEKLKQSQEAFSSWGLDEYLQYLKNWQFIVEENDRFQITSTGNLFLTFLAMQQLDKNKPLVLC